MAKNGIWSKKIFREIDLFDLTNFFAWTFLNFLAHTVWILAVIQPVPDRVLPRLIIFPPFLYSGAIKESRVLLTAYGLFIIIIAVLQITAIVLAVVKIDTAEKKTKEYFTWTIEKYYTTKEQRDAVTLSWDFMMAEVCIFF